MIRAVLLIIIGLMAQPSSAATFTVASSADLQPALNAAVGGDVIVLLAGVTYTGNFVLPVHAGADFVTVRTSTPDALLPAYGTRISPANVGLLPKIRSGNSMAALKTAPGANYWWIQHVEFASNAKGSGDIIQLGDGSSAQNTLSAVPQFLVLQSVYVHGDPLLGQKRGIALNSGDTTIVDSYVSDIKGIGIDTQAIGGWNGPGPYRVLNNFLEAAGEVFMLGGDDPKIANLVPADVEVRGNTLSRPVAWRNPIIASPTGVVAVPAFGSLPAGAYAYRVAARRPADSASIASSSATTEVSVAVGDGGGVTLQWTPVPDATEYRVYGRTPGGVNRYWTVAAPATTFTDTGTTGTSGTPAGATVWAVKNLFELKNARRVQIDYNLFEYNWLQAQSGIAIVLTPRNQGGNCAWCVVEDVTFEFNRVRHVAAGVSVLGWDNLKPSLQANNIRIRNNEFSDVSKTWGGTGYVMYVMDNARDVVVDHNTFISPDGSGVVNVSGAPTTGFVFTNNVARHNSYGIIGSGYGVGNSSINQFFPGAVITNNVFAGGSATLYPSGNLFPSVTAFQSQFVDYAAGNFALIAASTWRNAGTDGRDLGATLEGDSIVDAVAISTTGLPNAIVGQSYAAMLTAQGGVAPYNWSIGTGALPAGLTLDTVTGSIAGVPITSGASNFGVHVIDAGGSSADRPLAMTVVTPANRAPTATNATVQAVEETGTAIALTATDADGDALIYGLATLPQYGTLTGTAPQLVYTGSPNFFGNDGFTFTVTDSHGATSTGTVAIAVSNVNDAPVAVPATVSTAQDVPVAITLSAQDADGNPLAWSHGQPQSGVLSGSAPQLTYTPASGFSGTDVFTFTVSDGSAIATATVTISVSPAAGASTVAITTATLPDGKAGRPYSAVVAATGGTSPYRFEVIGGQLPGGVALDSVTGAFSGRPTAAGTYQFTVRATDAAGSSDDQTLTVKVITVGKK
jgi:hypothetical protein